LLGTQGTWAGGARANKQTSTIWPCFAILRPRKKKNLRFIDFAIFSGFRVLGSQFWDLWGQVKRSSGEARVQSRLSKSRTPLI